MDKGPDKESRHWAEDSTPEEWEGWAKRLEAQGIEAADKPRPASPELIEDKTAQLKSSLKEQIRTVKETHLGIIDLLTKARELFQPARKSGLDIAVSSIILSRLERVDSLAMQFRRYLDAKLDDMFEIPGFWERAGEDIYRDLELTASNVVTFAAEIKSGISKALDTLEEATPVARDTLSQDETVRELVSLGSQIVQEASSVSSVIGEFIAGESSGE